MLTGSVRDLVQQPLLESAAANTMARVWFSCADMQPQLTRLELGSAVLIASRSFMRRRKRQARIVCSCWHASSVSTENVSTTVIVGWNL